MKKLISLLLLLFVAGACSVDGTDGPSESYLLPIESVEMPQTATFMTNQVYEILVRYRRPSTCYIFNGFYNKEEGMTRTIGISCWKLNENNCIEDGTLFEIPMEFKPTVPGDYVLKFLSSDIEGLPEYIEYPVHVE